MDYLTLTIGKQKKIALIAHDSKKRELIGWCDAHKEILKHHFLCGTGTTARMITDATGLPVKGYNSGPVFRRSTRKVPSFSSRHFFISFPASRFFLYLQQIFNALLGLFLLKKFF